MSVQPAGEIPEWTLGDRLRKAREHARLKQQELAEETGISRASVVNYESGRYEPSRPVLLSWALCCGVDYKWLREGTDVEPAGLDLGHRVDTARDPGVAQVAAASGSDLLGILTPFPQVADDCRLAA